MVPVHQVKLLTSDVDIVDVIVDISPLLLGLLLMWLVQLVELLLLMEQIVLLVLLMEMLMMQVLLLVLVLMKLLLLVVPIAVEGLPLVVLRYV